MFRILLTRITSKEAGQTLALRFRKFEIFQAPERTEEISESKSQWRQCRHTF
jgi:hypothetical protein